MKNPSAVLHTIITQAQSIDFRQFKDEALRLKQEWVKALSARKAQTQRPGSEASKLPSQGSEAAAAVRPSSTASEAMRPPAAAVRPSPSEAGAAVRPSPSGGDVKAGASGACGAAVSPSVSGRDQPAWSGTEVAVSAGVCDGDRPGGGQEAEAEEGAQAGQFGADRKSSFSEQGIARGGTGEEGSWPQTDAVCKGHAYGMGGPRHEGAWMGREQAVEGSWAQSDSVMEASSSSSWQDSDAHMAKAVAESYRQPFEASTLKHSGDGQPLEASDAQDSDNDSDDLRTLFPLFAQALSLTHSLTLTLIQGV